MLVSVIDGAIQAAVQSSRESSGTVVVNPSATQDVMTEVLKSTINIPPTVVKHQGDRIQVLVARDAENQWNLCPTILCLATASRVRSLPRRRPLIPERWDRVRSTMVQSKSFLQFQMRRGHRRDRSHSSGSKTKRANVARR